MMVRIRWIAAGWAIMAMPAWAHCGFCGKGDSGAKEAHTHAHAEVGKPAPDFTLTGVDGEQHKLSDLKGKVVVLEWTNHLCPFVQRHQGTGKTMHGTFAKFSDKPVAWLAINSSHFCADKVEGIRTWIKEQKVTYPYLLDPNGDVGHVYDAKTTPHMFVIDQKGVLAYAGAVDDDQYGDKATKRNYVEEAVTALLNGSTVKLASTKPYGCSVKYKK